MFSWTSILIWMATYWLHSTLLLGGVWIWFRYAPPASHALRGTIWKWAAVGAILTASVQLGIGIESPINQSLRMALRTETTTAFEIPQSAKPIRLSVVDKSRAASARLTGSESADSSDIIPPQAISMQFLAAQPAMPEIDFITDASATSPDHHTQSTIADNVTSLAQFDPAVQRPDVMAGTVSNNQSEVRSVPIGTAAVWRAATQILLACGGAILALSLFGLLKLIVNQIVFVRRMRSCEIVTDGTAVQILNKLANEAGLRRPVTLLTGDTEVEPGAWGLFAWHIVLPPRAFEELSRDELRALLAHELAHLARGDQWWIWIGHLLSIGFGWQPLNQIAFREWRAASEFLADAWAVERTVPRLSLARCLASVAEWRLASVVPLAGAGGNGRSHLTHRVERLLDDQPLNDPWLKHHRRQIVAAAGAFLAVVMVCCAPSAMLQAGSLSDSEIVADASHPVAAAGPIPDESVRDLIPASISPHSGRQPEPQLVESTEPDRVPDWVNTEDSLLTHDEDSVSAKDSLHLRWQSVMFNLKLENQEAHRSVLLQVADDLKDLHAELSALEAVMPIPPQVDHSVQMWTQLQHIRVRTRNMIHIHEVISTTFKL